MRTIRFARERRYLGNKVIVPVRLPDARIPTRVDMVLDTGAGISLLHRMFASQLGLTISAGAPIDLMVANMEVTRAYIHPVEIDFLGRRMTIEAAFCPDWDTQNLLGMRGFFDQMAVAFDHAQRRLYF